MDIASRVSPVFAVEIAHAPTVNFAMEQAGVPVITHARIVNWGDDAVDGVELAIAVEPALLEPTAHAIGRLRAGETRELTNLDLQLRPGRLQGVLEAERAELAWELRAGANVLTSGRTPIEVLACNEWAGLRAPPALLATFVTPNDPVIAGVLRRVRERLRVATGDGSITGYQTRSVERVQAMVAALYETVQSLGLSYIGAPASFEDIGQKVRLADMLLRDSIGNCLDITVLVASCLEQMGLSPLIAIQKGHAFPGVWLIDERFPECVVYDAARVRTVRSLEHIVFFDSSAMVHEPPAALAAAKEIAASALSRDGDFLCVIDIAVARRDRYRPLSIRERIERAPKTSVETQSDSVRAILDEASRSESEPAISPTSSSVGAVGGAPRTEPAVVDRFRKWREKLLDLSLRNKLLNFRPDSKGSLPLDVPEIARLEDLLAAEQTFEIHARPVDPQDARDEKLVRAHGGDLTRQTALRADLGRGVLHCPLDEATMLQRAIHLDREARLALEEGGANVLYVAIGVLRWFESGTSSTERVAPLLLVPVQLEYIRTTRRVRLRQLPEDPLPNWTLIEKMNADFGVDLGALASMQRDESGLDVPAMFHGIREAIQRVARWEVLEEAHLGLFSFAKYLMWRDLVDNAEVLSQNDVVRHISVREKRAFSGQGEGVAPERLDDEIHPGKLPLIVDADSTQTAAVVSALRGRSFVLQGPPGTGKSQTITNLIAAALANGKTVLFVSEKMAALDVVYRRLQKEGLGDFCLELHSHKSQKREVVAALGRTLDRGERARRPRWEETSNDLSGMRARLNGYVRAIHAPTPLGSSFHQASAKRIALEHAPVVRIPLKQPEAISYEELRRALAEAKDFGRAAAQVEPVAAHPFRGCRVDGWSAQRDQETANCLADAKRALAELEAARAALSAELEGDGLLTLAELGQLANVTSAIAAGPAPREWQDDGAWARLRERATSWRDGREDQSRRRSDLARRWQTTFFDVNLADLEPLFARWATGFFLLAWLFLFRARRQLATLATSSLPGNRQIGSDLARARETNEAEVVVNDCYRALRRSLEGCGTFDTPEDVDSILARGEARRQAVRRPAGRLTSSIRRATALIDRAETAEQRASFGELGYRVTTALATYRSTAEALKNILAFAEWPADSDRHAEEVNALVERWATKFATHRPWCLYQRAQLKFRDAGYGEAVEAHARGEWRGQDCESAVERAILTAWLAAARDSNPVLRDFDGKSHHALVDQFRKADTEHIRDAKAYVAAILEERLPRMGSDVGAASEPGILRREMAKKTRHMPVRKLLQQMPNLLLRLKPCLLMSPLSVAQYLPAKGQKFDIVVFDEASQLCTHDAIGAIGRGAQVIVVGDSKQLPPTAFFQRASTDDDAAPDENDFTELESILDEALASGLPEQMLGWHYRSRHEALIEFSNLHYYDNRLNVFPAARGRVPDLGVKFTHVKDGFYESGKSRTNPKEARIVVDALIAALREWKASDRSFGIVTFSSSQQERIENLLESARKEYPEIEPHFADDHPKFEKVFVKNLENVQGDERDEIFFSVAYAPPDETGKMLMNFGPLNRDGGERRLNVAVTRARKQLRVFSSITDDAIETNRTRSRGAKDLKAFLRFAADRSAGITRSEEASGDFDSDFERDVFDVLRANGFRVDTQVGCGAYRIDLAVVHPERPGVYAIGIECDGAAYHSGATARDRDRLRQQVLEGLGWRLHRIWSTDWIYDRARQIDQLLAAIELAVQAPEREDRASDPALVVPTPAVARELEPIVHRLGEAPKGVTRSEDSPGVPYRRAEVTPISSDAESLYDAERLNDLRRTLLEILRIEAPMHLEDLARRASVAFGAQRLTPRIRRRILEVVPDIAGYRLVDGFVWADDAPPSSETPIRVGEERDAEMVPPEEIAAAARWVMTRSLSLPVDALLRETAKIFRMRLGAKVEARMRVGVDLLVATNLCSRDRDLVTWKGPPR